jgi:putative flippase GtrA
MTAELRYLARFCTVGVSNSLLTLVIFALFVHAGAPAPAASAIGFGAGACNGYLLNRRWTFRGAPGGPQTVARYLVVQGLGAGLSAAGMALATTDLDLAHLVAELLVLPCVAVITYVLARRLVFPTSEPA